MWTSHGHLIPGTDEDESERPPVLSRCGGPGICSQCSRECHPSNMPAQEQALAGEETVPVEAVEPPVDAEGMTAEPIDFVDMLFKQRESPIMRYFAYQHLPPNLQEISKNFYNLAWKVEGSLPPGPEKSVALRKLLEAKDAAVRAALDIPDSTP